MHASVKLDDHAAREEVPSASVLARDIIAGSVSAYLFHAYGFNTQNIGMIFYMAAALVSEFWKAHR